MPQLDIPLSDDSILYSIALYRGKSGIYVTKLHDTMIRNDTRHVNTHLPRYQAGARAESLISGMSSLYSIDAQLRWGQATYASLTERQIGPSHHRIPHQTSRKQRCSGARDTGGRHRDATMQLLARHRPHKTRHNAPRGHSKRLTIRFRYTRLGMYRAIR